MIRFTDKMRERMAAGVSWLYTTRDGHEWYIDSTLRFPFRQVDFAECMYDAWDGSDFEPHFPSLSMCQLALEEGCPQWRGVGWYWLGANPPEAVWIDDIAELRARMAELDERVKLDGTPYFASYGGDSKEPVKIY